jgi:site-specific recombinase XerD
MRSQWKRKQYSDTVPGGCTVNKLVERAGRLAEFEFPVHPHMLRHACGYFLANKGIDTRTIQDYLGRVSIMHTVRYTELSPQKFKGLWS